MRLQNNPGISRWRAAANLSSAEALEQHYIQKLLKITSDAGMPVFGYAVQVLAHDPRRGLSLCDKP